MRRSSHRRIAKNRRTAAPRVWPMAVRKRVRSGCSLASAQLLTASSCLGDLDDHLTSRVTTPASIQTLVARRDGTAQGRIRPLR
jgi:hypothetical protein